MRYLFLAALGFILIPSDARCQEITLSGMVRTISLMDGIRYMCSAADKGLALKMREAAIEVAVKTHGLKQVRSAFLKETNRRMAEVKATGAEQWCAYQVSHQGRIGSGIFP